MIKDAADLYQARGEGAREVLHAIRGRGVDALDLALYEAPKASARERYRYAREHVLPLLLRLEDGGEQEAALKDAADGLGLRVTSLRDALSDMEPPTSEEEPAEAEPQEPEPTPQEVEEIVGRPGVLERFVEEAAKIQGVVGERESLKLLTLNALGAQLKPLPNGRPAGANVVLTAEAGRGKNYLADAVAAPLPEEFYKAFESASAKSLYYGAERDPEIVKHRWIYPNEAEATDQLVEMFRPLISGGSASHLTVNKDSDGRSAAQEFCVEGPVTLTIPTIRNKLDTQLQTRMLVSELPDYEGRVAAHSRAFSKLLLREQAGEDHTPRIRVWQSALRGLTAVRRVVFDLDSKEFCFHSDEVSHGARLWGNLLGLMLAHAWLEQRNRQIVELSGGERAVLATPEDYEAAYEIFKATCERSIVNLSDTHRKVLDAVDELNQESMLTEDGFSLRKIAQKAGVHHSTVGDNKTYLTKSAKLLREVEGGGLNLVADAEPSWWQKDDLLVGFPRPEQVWRWGEEKSSHCTAETSRQTRHPDDGPSNPLSYAQKGVGLGDRQHADATRQVPTGEGVSGGQMCLSDEVPDSENPTSKPNSNAQGPVSGVSGGCEDDGRETFDNKREVFTI
jgi:hypothetical protein